MIHVYKNNTADLKSAVFVILFSFSYDNMTFFAVESFCTVSANFKWFEVVVQFHCIICNRVGKYRWSFAFGYPLKRLTAVVEISKLHFL